MSEWTEEIEVDEELAQRLVASQFAPLPERSVELVAQGWDYTVHLVDGQWAFRFPRRQVVVPGTEREIAVLPRIAPRLPVSVPAPVFVGRPTDEYPWPFYGARFLPGVEVGDAGLTDAQRVALARPLARALRALHAPELVAEVGPDLPVDSVGRGDMIRRVPRTREQLAAVSELGLWEPPPLVDELLERALRLPPASAAAICHGDLHFRQVLLDGGRLGGIIDWVDVCRGDPGIDLVLLWSFFPPEGRAEFLAEYGTVSEEALLRGRVLALFLSAVLARYGRDRAMASVEAEAVAGLRRAVAASAAES